MKKILLIIILALIVSCSQDDPNQITIHGSTDQVGNAFLTIIDPIDSKRDTANIQNGSFTFSQKISEEELYKLNFNNGSSYNLLISPGEKINISIKNNTIDITGSKGSIKLQELRKSVLQLKSFQDSITKEMQTMTFNNEPEKYNTMIENYRNEFYLELNSHNNIIKQFIDNNINSKACLLALFQQYGPKSFILNIDEDLDYFEKVLQSLKTNFPESNHIDLLQQQIEIAKPLAFGQPAPDFTMPDVNNNLISLSELKGKVVLIDFWASWCKPCRIENPKLVKLKEKYKKSNFEILSVSLDGNPRQKNAKQDWIKAIEQDNLSNFIHVSELKGFQTIVQKLYNFNSIPYTVIVDEEGKIAAKGLRGADIELKIAQLLNINE